MERVSVSRSRHGPFERIMLRLAGLAVALVSLAPAAATAADQGAAEVILVARSIGSRRGEPLDPRAHAALLVRIGSRPGGFVVQGGKEPIPGTIFGPRHRVVGRAIPARDPVDEFTRAVGGYWGEPGVREVPIREIARFTVKGLTEARLHEVVGGGAEPSSPPTTPSAPAQGSSSARACIPRRWARATPARPVSRPKREAPPGLLRVGGAVEHR